MVRWLFMPLFRRPPSVGFPARRSRPRSCWGPLGVWCRCRVKMHLPQLRYSLALQKSRPPSPLEFFFFLLCGSFEPTMTISHAGMEFFFSFLIKSAQLIDSTCSRLIILASPSYRIPDIFSPFVFDAQSQSIAESMGYLKYSSCVTDKRSNNGEIFH